MENDENTIKITKWNKLELKDGESGQGKTTILNVLSGIYQLKNGQIIIDNEKLDNPKLDVVYISQDVELFDLSIRDNLTLGKNISDKKIMELFEDAGLMEWYTNLPNGLDEMVGEKGVKLSAGQRQRLNIIRGILIDKYLNEKTYIIVTHRDSIKRLCNQHYVFKDHTMYKV